MNKIQKIILADLKALGKGKTAIAAGLKKRKVKGIRRNIEMCPVGIYLQDEYEGCAVAVGEITVEVGSISVPTPRAVADFIVSFDDGQYPDLEDCA